jgi:glycosyltransferase involved in cell wall biosynthesis
VWTVFSRVRFDDAGTPQCREPEGFYLRCRAAGFQVTNDPDTKVRSARTSSSPRPPLSYTTAGLVDASIRLPPSHSGPACTDLISVVVCTKGERTAHLERCLDSIGRLDDPNFEVILVHNASSPAPPRGRLEAHGAKLIHERQRGLDNARNSGVRESTGGIVAFVDDDCDVDPDWLKGFRRALSDPLVAFATGRVRPARLEDPCEQWFECHFSFDRGPFPQRFTTFDSWPWSPLLMGMLGTGANMAFRREILERIGDFDPALDMGTLVGGGGDLDIFARALADGKVCQYAPDAVVFHHHRDNMTKLRWQTWGYGICQGALCAKYVFRQPGYRLHALVQFIRLLRDHHRRAVASKSGSDRYPSALVNLELAGIVLGPFAYAASALFQRRSRR